MVDNIDDKRQSQEICGEYLFLILFSVSCKIPVGSSHKKPYDPLQFTEKVESGALKEAHHKLKLLEFDYKALHDKRLQDVSC